MNKAMNLGFYELIGDPGLINIEVEKYRAVDRKMVRDAAQRYFLTENCSTLYYLSSRRGK
jgi:hypothetical protein